MKNQIDITVSIDVIYNKLYTTFSKAGEPQAEMLTRKIIENLKLTEMGISQLFQAYLGMEEQTPWVVGDECLINPESVSSWNWDKAATIEKYPLYKDHIKTKIKEIDFRKKRAVVIEFDGFYGGKEKKIAERVYLDDLKTDTDLALMRPDLAKLL